MRKCITEYNAEHASTSRIVASCSPRPPVDVAREIALRVLNTGQLVPTGRAPPPADGDLSMM